MAKKHMHIKVEDTLLDNFDATCQQHGLDRSEVIRNLMFEFVNKYKEDKKLKVMINGVIKNLTGKAAEVVKGQPGYSAEKDGVYMLAKAKTGGIRLYKRVEGKWMDASLDDIQDDSITSLIENS
jgi:hypothetical protein